MVLDVLVLICFDVGFNIIICFNHFESCYRHVLALDSPGSMATGRLLERSLDLLVSIQLQGWKPAEFWGHVFLIRSIHTLANKVICWKDLHAASI